MKRAASRGLSDRPLDSFGGRLPCYLNYIGRFFSYWQGRFAACAFAGGFLEIERPWNSWGVAPNPTRELRPLTPQGTLSLDPFFASRLERASQRNRYRSNYRPQCLCQENRHPYRTRHIPQSKPSHQHRRNLQNLPQRRRDHPHKHPADNHRCHPEHPRQTQRPPQRIMQCRQHQSAKQRQPHHPRRRGVQQVLYPRGQVQHAPYAADCDRHRRAAHQPDEDGKHAIQSASPLLSPCPPDIRSA